MLAMTSLAFMLVEGAGTALDEVGDELVAQFAGDQAVARADDGVGDFAVEAAQIAVGQRACFLT